MSTAQIVTMWVNGDNSMSDYLKFTSRDDLRAWLIDNCTSSGGVWLLFGKAGGPKTITANEALEEALCFGWIDGQMKSLDTASYIKYFSPRRKKSNWSEKNKKLTEKLEKQGIITDHGRAKIEEAKRNGQWDAPKAPPVSEEQIAALTKLLKGHEPAFTNFTAMSPSVKRAYTGAYFSTKTEDWRSKLLARTINRLNQNLKPM